MQWRLKKAHTLHNVKKIYEIVHIILVQIFSKQNKEGDGEEIYVLHICYYGFFGGWIIKLQWKSLNQTNVNTFLIIFINWNSKRRAWKFFGFIGFSHA